MGKSQSNLNKQLLSLTPDALIDLYEIDFSNLQINFEMIEDLYGVNIGADTVYRFCPMINGTNPIIWQGKSYQPLPVNMEGFEQKADGTLSRPTFTIANPHGLFSRIVHSNKDFSNCKVTRKRTYARFLDDENFQNRNENQEGSNPFGQADSESHLPDDVYYINKKSNENKQYIQFELVSVLELENSPVPARVVLSGSCGWVYRCNIGCNYRGLAIESSSGEALTFSDSSKYPDGIKDIPEWNKYGLGGTENELASYTRGELVKIIGKSSSDPYKKIPQVFICKKSHIGSTARHPFFDSEHWIKDQCRKTLSSCGKRFSDRHDSLSSFNKSGASLGLPFGGFPGTEKFPVE
jgi:lambda family phage minor tail protein L